MSIMKENIIGLVLIHHLWYIFENNYFIIWMFWKQKFIFRNIAQLT